MFLPSCFPFHPQIILVIFLLVFSQGLCHLLQSINAAGVSKCRTASYWLLHLNNSISRLARLFQWSWAVWLSRVLDRRGLVRQVPRGFETMTFCLPPWSVIFFIAFWYKARFRVFKDHFLQSKFCNAAIKLLIMS